MSAPAPLDRDPWEVLGLKPGADKRAIKAAYRQLARRYHPDARPDDPEAAEVFLEVSQAYQLLTDAREQAAEAAAADTPTLRVSVPFVTAYQGGAVEVDLAVPVPCRHCRGVGCRFCHGTGKETESRRFDVAVAPGAFDGQPLTARERHGRHQLLVTARVEPSPLFSRHRERPQDLWLELPVTLAEAVLGTTVRVPTPDEVVGIRIPPGTQDGKVLLLSGRGMPQVEDSARGDLRVRIKLLIPDKLSGAQRRLFEELRRHEQDPRRHLGV